MDLLGHFLKAIVEHFLSAFFVTYLAKLHQEKINTFFPSEIEEIINFLHFPFCNIPNQTKKVKDT